MKYVVTKEMIKYLQDIYRLKNVIRYNTRNKLKDESVAEHSFYVALLSLYFCDEYNLSNKSVIICCLFIVTRRSTEKVPGVFICSKAYSCFFPYNTLEVSFSETFCFTVRTFSSKR